MIIRAFKPSDLDEILTLFYQTIHTINIHDYTQKQVEIWAPQNIDKACWLKKLSEHYTYVAEKNGVIVSFADLSTNGELDHLYVHRNFQRQGIASALLKKIEEKGKKLNLSTLKTHASITAKLFFEKHGFIVAKKQQVHRNNVAFTNFYMKKELLSKN